MKRVGWVCAALLLAASMTPRTAVDAAATTSDPSRIEILLEKASLYPSTINVSGLSGAITDVNVVFHEYWHNFSGDSSFVLVGPNGDALALMDRNAAPYGMPPSAAFDLTIDDEASTQLPASSNVPFASASYRPTSRATSTTSFVAPGPGTSYGVPAPNGTATLASVFDGDNPNGSWRLYIQSIQGTNGGAIEEGWSLEIVTGGTNPAAITIPSQGTATPYPSTINVSDVPGTITGLKVNLHGISHLQISDVGAALVAPDGRAMVLFDGAAAGHSPSDVDITIDDEAANHMPMSGALPSGSYKPTTYFPGDQFDAPGPGGEYARPGPDGSEPATLNGVYGGLSPNGTWSLFVKDFVLANGGQVADGWSLEFETTQNLEPIVVPSLGTAALYPSEISVEGVTGEIADVDVTLHGITHADLTDLGVVLVAPTGEALLLMDGAGGGVPPSDVTVTFDDDAATQIAEFGTVTSGRYRPTSYFSGDDFDAPGPGIDYAEPGPANGGSATFDSTFNGLDPNGTWSLFVKDFFDPGTSGQIAGWTLDITTGNTMDVIVSGPGSVTAPGIECPGDCTHTFVPTTEVELTPTADSGAHLDAWSLDCAGSGSCSILMDGDAEVGATFVPSTFQPDAALRNERTLHEVGLDVLSPTAQTLSTRIRIGQARTFRVLIENDGNLADTYTVDGCGGSRRYRVNYRDATGAPISAAVINGTQTIGAVDTDASEHFFVTVKPTKRARAPLTCNITTTSDGGATTDTVTLVVRPRAR